MKLLRQCRVSLCWLPSTTSPDESVSPYEQQFLDALPHITAVVRQIRHRFRLSSDEGDELGSVVRLRFIEDDYALLRRFEGRSSLRTYLTTVITRQFLDERVRAWGKWRASAAATRLGPLAVLLERTIARDAVTKDEAIAILVSQGRGTEDELYAIAEQLPPRPSRRLVDGEALVDRPSDEPAADHLVIEADARDAARTARRELAAVLATLPARDRLLLRLRFEAGTSIADIARAIHEPQKPLYRHLERLLARLRTELEARGISPVHIDAMTQAVDTDPDAVPERSGSAKARLIRPTGGVAP